MRSLLAASAFALSLGATAASLTEAECSIANPNTDAAKIADCLEAKIDTNCDSDSGSSSSLAICSWGKVEVVERRLGRVQRSIEAKLVKTKAPRTTVQILANAQEQWRHYRERHCRFSNAIANPRHTWDNYDLQYVSCVQRLTEQRVADLEVLAKALK